MIAEKDRQQQRKTERQKLKKREGQKESHGEREQKWKEGDEKSKIRNRMYFDPPSHQPVV